MRFIKRYPTEDEFAQQENMSGYPSNAVTTIRPGMAYVLDSKNVYYNEDPIPPLPDLKVWNYVSGLTYQGYSSEDGGENYHLTNEYKLYLIFDNPSAVTELTFIEKKRGYDYDNEIMYPWGPFGCARRSSLFYRDDYDNSIGNVASAQLSLPDPITVSQDSVYLLGFNTDTGELDSVSEMYTLGETVYVTPGSGGESSYKVYYKTGESTSTRYLTLIEYADNNYKYYAYGASIMNDLEYYVSTDGSDDPNDWESAYGYILDFSYYGEPDIFPYVFTTREKEIFQDGGTNYEQCTLSPNGLIGVEHVSGSTYKLTKMSWWPFTETEDDEDLISQFNIYFEADKYYAVAYELQDNQTHIAFFELEEYPDDDLSWTVDGVQNRFKGYMIKSMTVDGQPYPIPSGENFIEASPYFRSVSSPRGATVFQIEPNNGGLFTLDQGSASSFDWGTDDAFPMAFIFRLPLTEGIIECEDINPPSATTFVFDASFKKDSTVESLFCVSSDSEMVTEIRPSLHQRENAYLQTIEESQGEIYNDPTSITVTIINAKNLRSSFPETMTITLLKSSSDSYGINYTYQYGHDDFTFRFYYWLPYNEQGDTGSPGGPAIGLTFHMGFS